MGVGALGLILTATLNLLPREVLLFLNSASELFPTTPPTPYPQPPLYVPPRTLDELRRAQPASGHSAEKLEQEIARQQLRLEDLHRRVVRARECSEGSDAERKKREKEMWDVQTAITLLKRAVRVWGVLNFEFIFLKNSLFSSSSSSQHLSHP